MRFVPAVDRFSGRRRNFSQYDFIGCLLSESPDALLTQLGKPKAGGGCMHFKLMVDVDASVLGRLVANAVAHVKQQHA